MGNVKNVIRVVGLVLAGQTNALLALILLMELLKIVFASLKIKYKSILPLI
jgi:hypothetical protein